MTATHGFHRLQSLAVLPDSGLEVRIEAKPAERKTLAAYLDVSAVDSLRAVLLLQRWRGNGVRVTGRVEAALTQTCVVTLEPLASRVSAEIDRKFLPEAMMARDADPHELVIDPDGEDPPDPLPHTLDLGDLVAEDVALNLDPYPRKEDAADAPLAPDEAPANPFAILKGMTKG
jgi:uncharacterized metal-binding protein YceD (DUF177 family)